MFEISVAHESFVTVFERTTMEPPILIYAVLLKKNKNGSGSLSHLGSSFPKQRPPKSVMVSTNNVGEKGLQCVMLTKALLSL